MKVVFTEEALKDLQEIADWVLEHYPALAPAVERRIRGMIAHISRWPESARRSVKRKGVRVVSLGRYPYKIFYRIADGTVEILHIHHTAREPWDEGP